MIGIDLDDYWLCSLKLFRLDVSITFSAEVFAFSTKKMLLRTYQQDIGSMPYAVDFFEQSRFVGHLVGDIFGCENWLEMNPVELTLQQTETCTNTLVIRIVLHVRTIGTEAPTS